MAATLAIVTLAGATQLNTGVRAHRNADATTGWNPVAGLPLAEPAQLEPGPDGILHVTLIAKPALLSVSGSPLFATPFETPGVGASLDGPTMHVRPGGTIVVSFDNELGKDSTGQQIDTNIHYHGFHVAPNGKSDNIFRTFGAGVSQSIVKVPRDQPAGTFWYHVHYHGLSEGQVMSGLSGLLIVDPLAPAGQPAPGSLLPAAWQSVPQRQVDLRDIQIVPNTSNIQPPSGINVKNHSTRLLDSRFAPTFTMQSNQWELWRIANIGADIYYKVELPGTVFQIVGEDGLPVWHTRAAASLLIPPGKRFDVLVRIATPGMAKLESVPYAQTDKNTGTVTDPVLVPKPTPVEVDNKTVTTDTLATITVGTGSGPATPAGPVPIREIPERRSAPHVPEYEQNLADIPRSQLAAERRFVFSYGTGTTFEALINGQAFTHHNMPLAAPILNTVEEWTLVNHTTDDHPFHIHINGFQVISVNGHPYHASGHQDVVNIPKQYVVQVKKLVNGKEVTSAALRDGTVVIRQRYTDFTGWFVFHCHILSHEDAGMMAMIQVRANSHVPVTPPPKSVLDGM